MSTDPEPDLRIQYYCERVATRLGFSSLFDDTAAACQAVRAAIAHTDRRSFAEDAEGARIIVQREFVKSLAEYRAEQIREVLADSLPETRTELFSKVANLLEPQLAHPTLGDPPGAFFDPECWRVESVEAPTERDRDLRLAAFVAAMLFQEEGIERAGDQVQSVVAAISRARQRTLSNSKPGGVSHPFEDAK